MTVPLVMDVDTGVDDALALMWALASPDVDLLAVTCCAGNVPAPQAAANTLAVLELCGAPDVEVAVGSPAPLVEPLRTATGHGPRGLGDVELPQARAAISHRFAPGLLVDEALRRPGEILLVATGPLTNLALALRREPELPKLLRRLAIMGGSFEHPGNTTPAAEFNVAVDPEAASIVLAAFSSAEPRPLICGLNVTELAELRPDDISRLAELIGDDSSPFLRFISDATRVTMEAHDPLTVALALDASLGETRAGTVDIELSGRLTRGMTVVDWDGRWGKAPNAEIAVRVDADRFRTELVERLALLGRQRV
jgi:purine nucleosidase